MGTKKISKILPEFWLVFLSHSVLNLFEFMKYSSSLDSLGGALEVPRVFLGRYSGFEGGSWKIHWRFIVGCWKFSGDHGKLLFVS